MHIPDGLPVDEEGARTVRAAETVMAVIPGTSFLDALGMVQSACRQVDAINARHLCLRSSTRIELSAPMQWERVTVNLYAGAAMSDVGFSGVAYSGGVISHNDELFAIDLEQITLPAGGRVSLLVNHDTNRIAGQARAEVNGGALYIRQGRFSKATAHGREVAGLHDEGQPLKLSVGVSGRLERMPKPTALLLNSRQQTVQAVMRKARLLEVSIVPAGADPDAGIG
jgi:hypothetical protein